MRYIPAFLVLFCLACSSPVDAPRNLIPKDQMASLLADLAINDQMYILNQSGNMEASTIYILKKYKITSRQFMDSYRYYIANPSQLEAIYSDAQDMIKDKDPEAADYIKNKQKENPGMLPAYMR